MGKNIFIKTITGIMVCLVSGILFSAFLIQEISPTNGNKEELSNVKSEKKIKISESPLQDTIIVINSRKIIVLVPVGKERKGTFLVLHGWNLPPEDWATKTSLCDKIKNDGYYVVLPDMGKSAYQEKIFKETRKDWKNFPTRKWLTDTVIVTLQKRYHLLVAEERNFVVGLSTGARGAALVVLDLPHLFKAAAALSGDYDQSQLPNDKIMTGFYGTYGKNTERWKTTDNVIFRVADFVTPIYLGHGTLDKTCTPKQTRMLFDSIKQHHPRLMMKLSMPAAGHDYHYWNSEIDNILKFFKEAGL